MRLWMIFLIILLIYGLFFMWPIKRKIYKKNGRILSNVEMLQLAENGDDDAKKLKKMTDYFYALGIAFTLFFVLEKYNIVNF